MFDDGICLHLFHRLTMIERTRNSHEIDVLITVEPTQQPYI